MSKTSLSFDVFLTFLGQPRAKHILFRPFSAESLPRMLSKPIIPFGTSLKKSKKLRAIASAASGGAGSPGGLWEALGELWGALEELWEALGELWEGLDEHIEG